ncbi:MAG: PAS domain S-box protein [bacterium]
MRFQTKIILLVTVVSVSIGLLSSMLVSRIMRKTLEKQLEKQVIVIVRMLSHNLMPHIINGEVLYVKEALKNVVSLNDDIKYAYAMGFRNEIFAHTFQKGFPKDLMHNNPFILDKPDLRYFSSAEGPILEIGYPFIEGLGAHLHVGMDESPIFLKAKAMRRSILYVTLAIAILGGFIGIILSFTIVNPLTQLSQSIKAFGEGKNTDQFTIDSCNPEVVKLMRSFYQMVIERRQIENALRESERKYRILIESANDAIIAGDMETGRIIEVNKKAEILLGMPEEEIIGMHYSQLHPHDDAERYTQIVNNAGYIQDGIGENIFICHKDGRRIPVEISSSLVEVNGKKILQSIFRDITQRKKAEENLKKRLLYEEMVKVISNNALYLKNIDSFQQSSLEIMGQAFGASRAYIAQYNYKTNVFDDLAKWVAQGIDSDNDTSNIIHPRIYPLWMKIMKNNQVIHYDDIEKIPDTKTEELLRKRNVKSILVSPFLINEDCYGFMGFEKCNTHHTWLKEDIAVLKTAVHIIAEAIKHKKMEDKLITLEAELLDISRREQERIGHDLHDVLGQEFTGISCMAKVLEENLVEKSLPEAHIAIQIGEHVNNSMGLLRSVIKSLTPLVNDPEGLSSALQELSSTIKTMFGISCQFLCKKPIRIYDNAVATHLYRIAQEAINNAIKHGQAKQIQIRLNATGSKIIMTIKNNGLDFQHHRGNRTGKGLDIMRYRSRLIGASFDIKKNRTGGTIITICLRQSPAFHRHVHREIINCSGALYA